MSQRHRIHRVIESRREHELLLLCARTKLDAGSTLRLENLVHQQLDWDYLFQLAQRHCVLPLLHEKVNADTAVPDELRQRLQQNFRDNAAHNLLLAGELVRITRSLKSAGVQSLAYKGPALAVLAYGDLSRRQFVDLDIIVHARDVARAREVLRGRGFCAPDYLSQSGDDLLQRLQHNAALTRADDNLIVELHWRIAAEGFAFLPFAEGLWQRAIEVSVCGEMIQTLSPEDLLLALCIHGNKHFWERLSWVCDVARLVNSQAQLDWGQVLKLAGEAKIERMLMLGLYLAAELLDARLPSEAMRRAHADETAQRLAVQVVERMFDGRQLVPLSFARAISFNLRARRHWFEKARYCRYLFMPTDADLAVRVLPARLGFGYYVVRPFRLVWKAMQR